MHHKWTEGAHSLESLVQVATWDMSAAAWGDPAQSHEDTTETASPSLALNQSLPQRCTKYMTSQLKQGPNKFYKAFFFFLSPSSMEVKYYFSSCSQNETEPHISTGTASLHLYSLVPPPSLAHTEMCIPLLQNRVPGTNITNYYLLDHRPLCPSFSVPRAIK